MGGYQMKYELLSKIFYKEPDKYNEIYKNRFDSDSTIHIPLTIHDNPAFIVPTFEMMNLIERIGKRSVYINNLIIKQGEDIASYILWDFVKDDIVISNEIEGVSSTRKEVEIAIHSQKTKQPVRFKSLVGKYSLLLKSENYEIKTCKDVRKLYDAVTECEIDESNLPDGKIFRKDSVSVVTLTQKEKHRGIVPEEKIIEYMNASLEFLNSDSSIPSLVRIAAFHYLFGYIHPFYDGNGRTSRLISSFKMVEDLGLIIPLRLSYAIKNNVKKYYAAFDYCNDRKNKGDVTPFVLAFLELIDDSLDGIVEKLKFVIMKLRFYENRIIKLTHNDRCSDLWMEIVKSKVLDNNVVTVSMLAEKFALNENTVRKYLKYGEDIGILSKNKVGHSYTYDINLELLDNIENS